MARVIAPNDPGLTWQGQISLEHGDGWEMPWRIPHQDRELYFGMLAERASMPAGVRLSFRSNATSVAAEVALEADSVGVDLLVDGEYAGQQPLAGQISFQFDGLPAREKLVELWLPQFGQFRLKSLALSDGATLAPFDDTRPKWLTYGSSITQCRSAAGPALTWPAITARTQGYNLTCLGFGGQCHLDTLIAQVIRDRPADYLSMCVGINIMGAGSLSARTFRTGIIGFVRLVREGHPDTPFVVMSPICSPPRETTPNVVGLSLAIMREEVASAVEALGAHGDRNVHYVDGLTVFGPDLAHLLPDQLHPNAEGYQVMGKRFAEVVAQRHFG